MKKMKLNGLTKTKKKIIGIDYSLTSPAICVIDDDKLNFYYLTNKKKYDGKMSDNIEGQLHDDWDNPMHRFGLISDWVFYVLYDLHEGDYDIFIEGYSYGSKGQGLFQIAENCGILKYRLEQDVLSYKTVVPSVVKKGATGKGNADKDMMYEAFLKETKIDLKKIFDTDKVGNPVSDIVDSYYVAKVGYENSIGNKS